MTSQAVRYDIAPYEVAIAGLDDPSLRVRSFAGQERVSEPFEYSIDLISSDAGLALEDFIGRPLSLRINTVDGSVQRWVHGIIAGFQQAGSNVRVTAYRARVVPPMQLLSYRHDCRIFQDLTAPEIITEVFDTAGLPDYELKLSETYSQRNYCVQYRESDLNFISRLMEDEGLFYYFEHSEEGTKLIVIDQASAHPELPLGTTLEYHDTGGGLAEGEFVFDMRWQESLTTNAVVLRDFDFKKPSVEHLHVDRDVEQALRLERYDYPGIYETADVGTHRVENLLQALQASRRQVTASSTVRRLLPGYRFTLSDHPHTRFNREYIVTSVNHTGTSPQALEQDQGTASPQYTCQFTAVPADTVLRPEPQARRPRVDGVQTAIVVGPAGEEIYVDEFARVKVQFHWDRLGQFNEKSSCWLRVSQTSAGAGWGALDIPRTGHEVLVSFIEGDPDRPVITGRVYNGTNRPPNGLPAKKVQMSMKSNSSPGGGGSNELTFDDTKGEEGVFFNSQYGLTQKTGYNKTESVGNDVSLTVGNNSTKQVAVDEQVTIGANLTEKIGANASLNVGANQSESVAANKSVNVGSALSQSVGGAMSLSVGGMKTEQVSVASNELIGAAKTLNVGAGYQIGVGGAMNTTVGLVSMEQVGVMKHFKCGSKFQIDCGGAKLVLHSSGKIELSGSQIDLTASGNVSINGAKIALN